MSGEKVWKMVVMVVVVDRVPQHIRRREPSEAVRVFQKKGKLKKNLYFVVLPQDDLINKV